MKISKCLVPDYVKNEELIVFTFVKFYHLSGLFQNLKF